MSTESNFEQLGKDFQEALVAFMEKSDELRKNELNRVNKALAAYPLEEGIVKLVSQKEVDVYELGLEIHSLKVNMIVESMRLDAEEAAQKAEQPTIPDNIDVPDYAKGEENE